MVRCYRTSGRRGRELEDGPRGLEALLAATDAERMYYASFEVSAFPSAAEVRPMPCRGPARASAGSWCSQAPSAGSGSESSAPTSALAMSKMPAEAHASSEPAQG